MQRTLHAHMRFIFTFWISTFMLLVAGLPARAHETHPVGPHQIEVGWAEEPVFAGIPNAVEITLKDTAGKPVTGLGDQLKVEIIFGDRTLGPLSFEPAGEGEYRAPFIPTRPGNYMFRLVGSLSGQAIDQSFSPAQGRGLEGVVDPREIELPASDPSRGELASRLDRLDARLEALRSAIAIEPEGAGDRAGLVVKLGIAGIVTGTLALALSVTVMLRAKPRSSGATSALPTQKEKTHV